MLTDPPPSHNTNLLPHHSLLPIVCVASSVPAQDDPKAEARRWRVSRPAWTNSETMYQKPESVPKAPSVHETYSKLFQEGSCPVQPSKDLTHPSPPFRPAGSGCNFKCQSRNWTTLSTMCNNTQGWAPPGLRP